MVKSYEKSKKNRLKNVLSAAQSNYLTDYNQGPTSTPENYGRYCTYLYLSYYVDYASDPARDFPYIITTTDIQAYEHFMQIGKFATIGNSITEAFGAIYTGTGMPDAIDRIHTADSFAKTLGSSIQTGIDASNLNETFTDSDIIKLAYAGIKSNIGTVSNAEDLETEVEDYIVAQMSLVRPPSEEDINDKVYNELAKTGLWLVAGLYAMNLEILSPMITITCLYTYVFNTYIQYANLVVLHATWRDRYIDRMTVYMGF